MNDKEKKHISKFLSLVLRHQPQELDIVLDTNGYVSVNELITKINQQKKFKFTFTQQMLDEVVSTNDKQRFAFNDSKNKIRASQGHSVSVELAYKPVEPPEFLYHGTTQGTVNLIKDYGIKKMTRQHVHLSSHLDTAIKVGTRHGTPYTLKVDSKKMYQDGIDFYLSDNGVWLTNFVDSKYIDFSNQI